MKKRLLIVIILFIFPLTVFAYSDKIIPGGQTIGLEIKSDGILIVGYYKINGEKINQHLQIGDKITKIAGTKVNDIDTLTKLLEENIENNEVAIEYKRNGKLHEGKIELSYFNGNYRTGLYVKGTIAGIGTLTYIDPETHIYGTLGHIINESKTNTKVEVKEGESFEAKVTSFTKSIDGIPGSKNANILKNKYFGTILNNTEYGVFGKTDYAEDNVVEVGNINGVKLGDATIYTTDENNSVKEFKIEIKEIDKESKDKNYYFEITDKELLKISGGIVQGMSGSPIIQNGKIIGAVTRVIVDDVKKGYGINIETMLKEGDKIKEM